MLRLLDKIIYKIVFVYIPPIFQPLGLILIDFLILQIYLFSIA